MRRILLSFKNAWTGICLIGRKERNFKIHLFLFALVIAMGIYFRISSSEWLFIILFSALVLSLEAINSAIEKTCDLITKEENASVKNIKDIAAGAVLIASILALVGGIAIFGRHLF